MTGPELRTTQTTNKWWGYRHTSGSVQAKRFFDQMDIDEANQSPFCKHVIGPFDAATREEALSIVEKRT